MHVLRSPRGPAPCQCSHDAINSPRKTERTLHHRGREQWTRTSSGPASAPSRNFGDVAHLRIFVFPQCARPQGKKHALFRVEARFFRITLPVAVLLFQEDAPFTERDHLLEGALVTQPSQRCCLHVWPPRDRPSASPVTVPQRAPRGEFGRSGGSQTSSRSPRDQATGRACPAIPSTPSTPPSPRNRCSRHQ